MANPAEKIYFFEKGDGTSWLVSVSGGVLYRLNSDSSNLQYWDAVGDLESDITIPSFLTFNNRLLIADGGMKIKAWGGGDAWSDSYVAAYVDAQNLTLDDDQTDVFFAGQSLRLDCGTDGVLYGTAKTVEYSSSTEKTTIALYDSVSITVNIAQVAFAEFTTLPNSPMYATSLAEIGSRVVCNSGGAGELDAVYFSAAEDEETWDTSADGVGMRAGFGDGMRVNALGVIGTDLLVFKGGTKGRRTYRIACNGTASDWYDQLLTSNATATTPGAIEEVIGDVWFADDTGLKAISQVQTYGDLGLAMAGQPIDRGLAGKSVREMTYLPSLGIMTILIEGSNDIYVYHPHNKAFTTWDFGVRINSICEGGGKVYLAASNGYLYRIGIDGLDELVPGTTTAVAARAEGRQYTMPADGLIRKTRVVYDELSPATGTVEVGTEKGPTEVTIGNITPIDTRMLVDATDQLATASNSLARTQRGYIDFRSRVRSGIFSFSVSISEGRIRLNGLTFDVATVDG